jgi:hypothetical protein
MAERDKLPATSHTWNEVALATQSGTLVTRGLEAIKNRSNYRTEESIEGNLTIAPEEIEAELDRYSLQAKALLPLLTGLSETEMVERFCGLLEHPNVSIDGLCQILKGARIERGYSLLARFCYIRYTDPNFVERIDYYYNFHAIIEDIETGIFKAMRFDQSIDGAISAFFVASILPMVGAYGRGCFAMDRCVPIPDLDVLHSLLNEHDFDLSGSTLSKDSMVNYTLGLRISRNSEELRCACLGCDEGSIIDYKYSLDMVGHFVMEEPLRLISRGGALY